MPGDPYPHFIDRNSTSLKVLMHIRDEAHRFGITHHRNRRSASSLVSELDNIPGVGAVSREKLVTKYKTLSRIKSAPYREIVRDSQCDRKAQRGGAVYLVRPGQGLECQVEQQFEMVSGPVFVRPGAGISDACAYGETELYDVEVQEYVGSV